MKSGNGVVETTAAPTTTSSSAVIFTTLMKKSIRIPVTLLFLIAVATVLSCRSAIRRCVTYQPSQDVSSSLLPAPDNTIWNATLLRLASININEQEENSEIEGLLDSNGFGYDGQSTHRSIVSWRQFHRLGGVRRSSTTSGRISDVNGWRNAIRLRLSTDKFSRIFPDFHRYLREWSRNRRFHPGVMSDLLDLVKRPIDVHRGTSKSEQGLPYSSCAVVGNSGILLNHEHGDLIDGHDLVIRLNNARTEGYSRHVGNKTSLAFVNSNILHICGRREGCYCHPYGQDVPMIMYVCQPVHFLDYVICHESHKAPLLITDSRFDMLCSRIVKYYSLKRFVEETGKAAEEWGKNHDVKMFHYSSGMQAIVLAVGICDQVSIFGFGKSADVRHHYHTNQRGELDLHDYEAEYAFYDDLVERPEVIPFLAESGFKVPPVVIYR